MAYVGLLVVSVCVERKVIGSIQNPTVILGDGYEQIRFTCDCDRTEND